MSAYVANLTGSLAINALFLNYVSKSSKELFQVGLEVPYSIKSLRYPFLNFNR